MRSLRHAVFSLVAVVAFPSLAPAAGIVADENPVAAGSFAALSYALDKGDAVQWDVAPEPVKMKEYTDDGAAYLHFNGPPGKYSVTALVVNFDTRKFVKKKLTVTIGKAPQPPPGPVPPTPPDPTPGTAPIPAAGLHVLVIYDAQKLSTLTATQQGAIYAKSVRDYLRATCPKGPDGVTAEWRMWPSDVDATGESQLWQDAFKRPRTSLPWVIVSNGTTGYEGPLPGSAEDMLALLKQYGGK